MMKPEFNVLATKEGPPKFQFQSMHATDISVPPDRLHAQLHGHSTHTCRKYLGTLFRNVIQRLSTRSVTVLHVPAVEENSNSLYGRVCVCPFIKFIKCIISVFFTILFVYLL